MMSQLYDIFQQEPSIENCRQLSTTLYEQLTGHSPTATVKELVGESKKLGTYNRLLHTCYIRKLTKPNYMLTILGHELCHAQARRWIVTEEEEARVEMFELGFAKRLEEMFNGQFLIPLEQDSLLKPYEACLIQMDSHELLDRYSRFNLNQLDI